MEEYSPIIKNVDDLYKLINGMARELYRQLGYNVERSYDFYKARHPQERMVLKMAISAYEYYCYTDYEEFESELIENEE